MIWDATSASNWEGSSPASLADLKRFENAPIKDVISDWTNFFKSRSASTSEDTLLARRQTRGVRGSSSSSSKVLKSSRTPSFAEEGENNASARRRPTVWL